MTFRALSVSPHHAAIPVQVVRIPDQQEPGTSKTVKLQADHGRRSKASLIWGESKKKETHDC